MIDGFPSSAYKSGTVNLFDAANKWLCSHRGNERRYFCVYADERGGKKHTFWRLTGDDTQMQSVSSGC